MRTNLIDMHEWLSGGASPCQGEGRGFESRLVLYENDTFKYRFFVFHTFSIPVLVLYLNSLKMQNLFQNWLYKSKICIGTDVLY